MISWTNLSLKHRLTLIGIVAASLPFPFVAIAGYHGAPVPAAQAVRAGLTPADLDHYVDSAYQAAEFSARELSQTLALAGNMIANDHGVRQLKTHPITWPVVGAHPVKLPPLSIRRTVLAPGPASHRAFVSEFSAAAGTECSLFQRMNNAGDMLWIATSLSSSSGQRVLGTVLPAGAPAVAAVLEKKPFIGPLAASGLNSVAGFKPITRADGAVIGILAVSVGEADQLNGIRQALSRIPVTHRAQLFAGNIGLPIAPGTLKTLTNSVKTKPAEIVEARYALSTQGPMLAHVRYFAPYNWLVGVAVPQSEIVIPAPLLPNSSPDHTALALAWIFALTVLVSAALCWRFAGSISAPVLAAQRKLAENVGRMLTLAGNTPEPAVPTRHHDHLVELTSTAAAQAGRTANLLLAGAGETMLSTQDCRAHADKASAELAAMQTAIEQLTASNSAVSGLVKEIGSIALQSRLLALNASIEAARAGHHGASFSVVADEFGKLAQRCSENARSTTALLTNAVTVSTSSTEHLARLSDEIGHFSSRTQAAVQSLEHLLDAANGHARTLSELDRAIKRHASETPGVVGVIEEIRAEALSLEQNAEEIAAAVAGSRAPMRKSAKRRVPKSSRSFAAKAPADIQPARPAC